MAARWSIRSLAAAAMLVVAGVSGGTVLAVDDPLAAEDGSCTGWGGSSPLTPDAGGAGTALGPDAAIPICTLDSIVPGDVPMLVDASLSAVLPVDLPLSWLADPSGDGFMVRNGRVPGNANHVTDLTGVAFGSLDVDRPMERAIEQKLRDLPRGFTLATSQPVNKVFDEGRWTLYVFDTEGDPTSRLQDPVAFQLAFQGPPGRSVPAHFPDTNPLDGARDVFHLWGTPIPGGDTSWSVQASDFGVNRLGPDGTTAYYNVRRPRFFSVIGPGGVLFFVRIGDEPTGDEPPGDHRPMAYDSRSGVFDIIAAPDGPMAFVPGDGEARSYWDWVALGLIHDPVTDQSFLFDGQAQSGLVLPSGVNPLILSPLLAGIEPPPTATFGYEVGGNELTFPGLAPLPTDGAMPGMVPYLHGIPSYGTYCPTLALWDSDPAATTAANPWGPEVDATEEWRRALGTSCIRVDEAEGLLHGAAWAAFTGTPDAPTNEREVIRKLFEEAGWRWDPDAATWTPMQPVP